jgi:segregation and condensation protein B
LESLAIVAYKQPVTRGDIEVIRGVNSDGVVGHLLERELIKIVGRKDVPGKPYLYGTTKQFLEYFGLKSLNSLPKLEEFSTLEPVYETAGAQRNHHQSRNKSIPDQELVMNSLEQSKQDAIRLSESNPQETK